MMRAGIYYNKNYFDENKPYIDIITGSLLKNEIEPIVVKDICDIAGLDVLFVLGGDGTILMVASECAKHGVKIIGINYGHLGFLTEFEQENIDDALKLVIGGKFKTQKRSMLEISCADKTFFALNDFVIQRSTAGANFTNTVNLQAYIDGSLVDNYSADGIIVSTPTGSTAYSLSAGGSILTPDLNAFIMTPICAHSLHSRPVVFNDNSVLEIVPNDEKLPLNIIIDGKVQDRINKAISISVKKSKYFVEFIICDEKDFFEKLLFKLNIWSR